MREEKYRGYSIALHSSLGVEECLRRLDAEFPDPRGRWQHARSDKRLLGWREKREFVICPAWRFDVIKQTLRISGDADWDTTRVCRVRFQPANNGCTISGSYRYAYGEDYLIQITIGLCFGFIFGPLFVILGLVALFATLHALWLILIGVIILAACAAIILNRSDDKFPQERDYIARFLARVLEAEPTTKPVSAHCPGVRFVR